MWICSSTGSFCAASGSRIASSNAQSRNTRVSAWSLAILSGGLRGFANHRRKAQIRKSHVRTGMAIAIPEVDLPGVTFIEPDVIPMRRTSAVEQPDPAGKGSGDFRVQIRGYCLFSGRLWGGCLAARAAGPSGIAEDDVGRHPVLHRGIEQKAFSHGGVHQDQVGRGDVKTQVANDAGEIFFRLESTFVKLLTHAQGYGENCQDQESRAHSPVLVLEEPAAQVLQVHDGY